MAHIISASRRTDIPRYYARWFAERLRAGFAAYRNVFGGSGRVSLQRGDVLGYLFWSKYARPFRGVLEGLRAQGIPYAFQYTITGYGARIEPHVPPPARVIDDFLAVAQDLPNAACIQWRYDPIVLSDTHSQAWHLRNFREIAGALAGATKVVNISFTEPYVRTIRRMADPTVEYRKVDPHRHRTVANQDPPVPQVGDDGTSLLRELTAIARESDMELRACSNPEWDLPRSMCCGPELFAPYGPAVGTAVRALRPGPSRDACRCVRTYDIGMDNTCVAGCLYCYVVTSQKTAIANMRRHDPNGPSLR